MLHGTTGSATVCRKFYHSTLTDSDGSSVFPVSGLLELLAHGCTVAHGDLVPSDNMRITTESLPKTRQAAFLAFFIIDTSTTMS